jgi:hypothetical protein
VKACIDRKDLDDWKMTQIRVCMCIIDPSELLVASILHCILQYGVVHGTSRSSLFFQSTARVLRSR